MLRVPSFQKWLPFVLIAGIAHGRPEPRLLVKPPRFTVHDAIWAEWMRAAPELNADALPRADRERYQLTLQRIGAPGLPKLLPPELENPTLEIWEAKAKAAKTPQDRFTALFLLNRLKSPKALSALEGLKSEDAKTWPRHLYLDANIATARLQGGEVSDELESFLDALKVEGKVEPVRAQAARLRLVMSGIEKSLLPPILATPGAVLALFDSMNRTSWEKHSKITTDAAGFSFREGGEDWWTPMGLALRSFKSLSRGVIGLDQRIWEGLPSPAPLSIFSHFELSMDPELNDSLFWRRAISGSLQKFPVEENVQEFATSLAKDFEDPLLLANVLPGLRKQKPYEADHLRAKLLSGTNPIARAAAIEDLPEAPSDLDALTQLTWKDRDLEPQQTLIESYSRWKLPKDKQIELLKLWLQHPDWACRYLAYQQLVKLDAATAWPTVPQPDAREKALLQEAVRLATTAKPLRLRITFSGQRHVTLRLDPTIAPINVANLATLARKGFFNGRLVPRVVPDFVVQMGSPYDTMDGGPGYSVRCEDSLEWYGPGSVCIALSGKDTGGSQFFITTNATPHLTGKYTRLGEVEDLDRVLKLLDDLELGAKIERVDVLSSVTRNTPR